jgi:hypothetical protein
MAPESIILNGDILDASTVSRFPPIGWEKNPALAEEIMVANERLHELVMAKPIHAKCFWPLGNHDARFETRLATVAKEYSKIKGIHLADHFDDIWEKCWSVWINDEVVIKHRFKSGIHGTHNSTLWAGKTIITGHDHALRVSPFSDYNGTRWGVSSGTLADPYGPQFTNYSEDNPKNHRAGFVVLTFLNGRLLWPELVAVVDEETVDFRGKLIKV